MKLLREIFDSAVQELAPPFDPKEKVDSILRMWNDGKDVADVSQMCQVSPRIAARVIKNFINGMTAEENWAAANSEGQEIGF